MLLQKLTAIDNLTLIGDGATEITGVALDSRAVKPGSLFCAISGVAKDGRAFIPAALEAGAKAILVSDDTAMETLPSSVAVVKARDVRIATTELAARFYDKQPEVIVGITGTSGKTSTALFTAAIWKELGHRSASLGTIGLITPESKHYGSLTTPDQVTLHQILNDVASSTITHLAMEVSSHSIDLHRVDAVRFKAGLFTNLSRDHLDYHETMEAYLTVKRRLFTDVLPEGSTAVLNADIPEYDILRTDCDIRKHKVITYGLKGKDIRLLSFASQSDGQVVALELFGKAHEIFLPIMGSFQVFNSMGALGLAIATGEDPEKALATLSKLETVPGRLQFVGKTPKGGVVFVDYAHKPTAMENVLNGLRPHVESKPGAKLAIIFGCGGNRDKGKRPMMAQVAQHLADWSIVTDDNPRHEDATTIRKEVMAGYTDLANVTEIGDRGDAIKTGIDRLNKDDILVIAGKGHESGQTVGDKVLPFDDCDVAKKCIEAMK